MIVRKYVFKKTEGSGVTMLCYSNLKFRVLAAVRRDVIFGTSQIFDIEHIVAILFPFDIIYLARISI